jgi:hypothetical protein
MLENVEQQKQWLLVAEEAIMNLGDECLADYFKIVNKLAAFYADLQVFSSQSDSLILCFYVCLLVC